MGPQGTSGSVCRHAGLWRVTRGEGAPGTPWVEASDGATPRGNEQGHSLPGIVCPWPMVHVQGTDGCLLGDSCLLGRLRTLSCRTVPTRKGNWGSFPQKDLPRSRSAVFEL